MSKSEFKLCYVDFPWCYFTTAPLEKQWGDDWDDAPYDCNAGPPYDWAPHRDMQFYETMKVAVFGNIEVTNSELSVKDINSGACSWLTIESWERGKRIFVPAGITQEKFIRIMDANEIEVYTCHS